MSFSRYPEYRDSGVEWLGEVPAHWSVLQSRRMFAVRSEPAFASDQMLTASQKYGVLYQKDFVELEGRRVVEVIMGTESLKHVEPDDFIISMRSFQGGLEWSRLRGSTSFHYVMVKPVKGVYPPFFSYLFKSTQYIQALRATTDLIRDGQELRYSNFVQVDLPLVPIEEQIAIAAFLDHETAKIDALIAEQEKLIALLKEKRQAVISHAVTKGPDPNVSMEDSGVEWLGKVPAHWNVLRLKVLAESIKAGPFGSALTKDQYVASGYRVYGQEQVIPADFSIGDYFISAEKFEELRQYATSPGDILISCVGTFGKIALVPEGVAPGIINPRLLRLRVGPLASPEFLCTVLRSDVTFEQFALTSRGGTMEVINIGTLADIQIAVPPIDEQRPIVARVCELSEEFDALADQAESAIALIKERRAALITAAITGQIDVRNFAARQTT